MAVPKFIKIIAGVLTEVAAIATSAGAGDADKIPATGAAGTLDGTLMPGGAPVNASAGAGDAAKLTKLDAAGKLDASFMPGGVPVNTSAGAGDSGKLPKLDAAGKLDTTMMPTGIGADSLSVVTSENLAAGNIVNLYNNAGTLTARKADATAAGKEANGFVLASSTSPAANTVYFDGTITGLSGLTLGTEYFLDKTSPGTPVATPPSATGNIVQKVGKALSASTLSFQQTNPVTLA